MKIFTYKGVEILKKVGFFTLGCRVNQYETEAMCECFIKCGYEICDFNEICDVYVINSCTVTGTGDKKSRQAVRRAKRQNPDAVTVLAGCYAQYLIKENMVFKDADVILGTGMKGKVVQAVELFKNSNEQVVMVEDLKGHREFEETPLTTYQNKTRAMLKIEDGCDRFCSYCIIPYVRGPVRSRNMEEISTELKKLGENGFKEVVITGIQVAAFGKDLKNGYGLVNVIERAAKEESIERIRLGSLEPTVITEDFLTRVKNTNKFCPSFHLSLQSGCDSVLKRMNRRYTVTEYKNAVELIRKFFPDAGITTDIIVGFPGETEEEFASSLDFAKSIGFSHIHVFPYSIREGTKAALMEGQIDKTVKDERVKKMSEVGTATKKDFLSKIVGNTYPVLFEQEVADGIYEGHTPNYVTVRIKSYDDITHKIINITLTEDIIYE